MTVRPGARTLATAAVAAKDWLIEPVDAGPAEAREPVESRRLRAVPPSPVDGGQVWLAPTAGGPTALTPPETPPHNPRMAPGPAPSCAPLRWLPETPSAVAAPAAAVAEAPTTLAESASPLAESASPLAGSPPPQLLAEPALPLAGRGVVAVIGLGRRCGATVVARALACELARRDGAGASAVTADATAGGLALGLPAAGRLARMLAPAGVGRMRPCGRLCLVDTADRPALAGATLYIAPLVLDDCDPHEAPVIAAIADHLVIVGGRGVEPALARALATSLAPHAAGRPLVVANRVSGRDGAWAERADFVLPESRLGAQLALAGQEPRGALGRAVGDLADRLEAVAVPT